MMPGETHSNTAGLATEGPGLGCQNCSVLQQNLNQYVDALVALKQKIIETDHLLTKYQQKCDELQLTERENSTLRHQLEQMLQKIATHDNCLGELQHLQSELEEKKSSLKIYQDIQEEYIRIKEEFEQSDFGKKKLEARVKKLEDAAAKHNSDMKQLKMEKKTIQKELKKTQEKLEEHDQQQRRKKRMKHAVTQFTSEEPVVTADKEKIKHLLEELWVCFDFATQEKKNKDVQSMLEKTPKKCRRSRKSSDYILPSGHSSLLETSEMQPSARLTGKDKASEETFNKKKHKSFEDHAQDGDSAFYDDRTTDISVQKEFACSSIHCSDEDDDDDDDELGKKLHFVLNWARPLPPLLSPVHLSPSRTQDALFGKFTDSSDDEIDCSTSKAEPSSDDGALECQINCTFVSGQEKPSKDKATIKGCTTSHVLEHASNNERWNTAKLAVSLSPNLYNLESVSVERKEFVNVEEQVLNQEPTALDRERMQSKQTQNMTLKSNYHQSKTSELAPSQEKASTISNAPTHHENVNEKSMKVMQSEGETCVIDGRSADLQHSSEQFDAPVESKENTCETVHSLVTFECSPEVLVKGGIATKDKFCVHRDLTDQSNNVLQFGVTAGANHDRLPIPEISENTFQNCIALDSKNLMGIKGIPTKEAMFSQENPFKSKVGEDTKKELHTGKSLVDYQQGDSVSSSVVQDKVSKVGTEIDCKMKNSEESVSRYLFEHSYSCLAQDITNTCKGSSLEGKMVDKEISRETGYQKDDVENNTVSVEITSNVQSKETIYSDRVIINDQGMSDTGKLVTSVVLVTQASSVFSEENTRVCKSKKSTNKYSVQEIENNFEQSLEINSNSAFYMNCTETETAEVASVGYAGHIMHCANVSNFVEISTFVESEQKCTDKITISSKDNLDMCNPNSEFAAKLTKLQTASSLTSEQHCKKLEMELSTDLQFKLPPHKIITNNTFEPLASDKRTVVTKRLMVEPENPTSETSRSMQPENVCVSNDIKAQTECGVSSLSVCSTGKPLISLSKSTTEKGEAFENKGDVDKSVLFTNVKDNVFTLVQAEVNNGGIEISHSDLENKMSGTQLDSKLNQSCSADRCIAPVAVPPYSEQGTTNSKLVVSQVENLKKEVLPCIDHDAIALQFANKAGEHGKNINSKNIMIISVNQTSAKSASQPCKSMVNSEKNPSAKYESCRRDRRVCRKADTLTHIVPNLNRQGVVDVQVDKLTVSEQPSCSSTDVIPEKEQQLSSCKLNGKEQESNNSNLFPENIKHFKTEQNHLDFSVVCRQGVGALQHSATNLPKDDNKGLVSVNISLKGSEEMNKRMKWRHAGNHGGNIMYPNVPSFRSTHNPAERKTHEDTSSTSKIKVMKEEEDSDLEDDFPVRKVSNTNRHIYRKPNKKKYMDDVLKLTKMMQHISTTNVQEHSKMTSSLNAGKRVVAKHLTAISPTNVLSEIKQANHLSGILRTKVKSNHQAVFSFEANSVVPNSVTECNPEADKEEAYHAKIVAENNSSLMHLVEQNITPSERLAQSSTENSTLESGSVHVKMLSDHVHMIDDFVVKNAALTIDRTVPDTVINVKSGTKEIASEPQIEDHQTVSQPPRTPPFCQDINSQGLDLSRRKMEQSSLSSSSRLCNVATSHAGQPNGKTAGSGQHGVWNIPVTDSDLGTSKCKRTIALRSAHRTLLPEFFSMCKTNVNNTSSNKINKASNAFPKYSEMALSNVRKSEALTSIVQGRGKVKVPLTAENLPIVANADTSTKTKHSPDTISKVRSEMGPPLPPLLQPLIATPPRTHRPISPIMSTSSRSSLPSPLDDLISPLRETPVAPLVSPLPDDHRFKSLFTTPSPSERSSKRIVSSPLQFCAATPKHALPVPGRLPPSASGNAQPSVPQENSVRILDSMYPELSAQARTLNILKGNIQLSRDCKHLPGPVNKITGFKAITSTSTVFVKTGKNSKINDSSVPQQDEQHHQLSASSLNANGKRAIMIGAMPRSAKRLCLGTESPNPDSKEEAICSNNELNACDTQGEQVENTSELSSSVQNISQTNDEAVNNALVKIGDSCFDLLPVINSHVYVGNISMAPVMRDEEKEVVHECTVTKRDLAEPVLRAIVKKLKDEMSSLEKNHLQSLCRVYVGICRQLGDLERARLFCYNILKEDFPESAKLTLFIISVWHEIFALPCVVNKAMQSLMKHRAKGDVLACLTAYLKWEKGSPLNVGIVLSSVLVAIQLCPNMKFQSNEECGEDLSDGIWQYVYAVDLLCCHRKWVWTHDHVISKELWPVMDKWVKYRKGHINVAFTSDVTVAAVLRLIGRLSQIGLKEGFVSAVKNISSVISTFIRHAKEEDMPWEVQLASVYALCDMASGDPAEVLETLQTWRRATTNIIPPAVTKYIAEISSLCVLQN